jgi:hypothetical protein
MSENNDNNPAPAVKAEANSDSKQSTVKSPGDLARRAEHLCQATLATHAANSDSLEVTRPTVTNCPDGGHDIGVTGQTGEVKELVSTLTGQSTNNLEFLDKSAKNGKLKVRIDVKNGKTISADVIDKHAADSNRSPDCQVNLLVLTNENVKVTPAAQKKLNEQQKLFKENGTLVDIASPDGLKKVESNNKAIEKTETEKKSS